MSSKKIFYPDSKFGDWFIRSNIWSKYVLREAIASLRRLYIPISGKNKPVILDAGCGYGQSFKYLVRFFNPVKILAIDVDPKTIPFAKNEATKLSTPVEVSIGDCARLPYQDQSIDIVFCHQTLHHLLHQESALKEFKRTLKPDGFLVIAESTRVFINSLVIDVLFRHPSSSQKTIGEYMNLIEHAGFDTACAKLLMPEPWWTKGSLGRLIGLSNDKQNTKPLMHMVIGLKAV